MGAVWKSPNLRTWLLVVACMGSVVMVALSVEPSRYDYECFMQFGTEIEPCYEYLERGGDVPKECCEAVKANVKVFKERNTVCDCIHDLSQGATEAQTDRFFALPGNCVDDSRLKFTRHTNCSLVN